MAEVFPTSLKHRTTPNLRLGIKSSCGDLKSIIAALYIIFKSSRTPENIVYSKEKVLENGITGIELTEELASTISATFPNIVNVVDKVNSTPLFTRQCEPLQVAIELFFNLGRLKFADNGHSERTGKNRYKKTLMFSDKMIVIDAYLSAFNPAERDAFLNLWLEEKHDQKSSIEDGFKQILSTFTIDCCYKIKRGEGNELIFNLENIYEELANNNDVLFKENGQETVGPTRVLCSYIKEHMSYDIACHNEKFIAKDGRGEYLKKHYGLISNTLDLINRELPFNDVAKGNDIKIEVDKEIVKEKFVSFITALRAKPFLLLAGISGTGKSQKVQELAYMTCPEGELRNENGTAPGNYCLVEVKPNWHDSTELLGYYSALSGRYELTDFIRFVYKAIKNENVPFFLCLDEMNLAPVEQYFAEYLSVLETRKKVDGKIQTQPLLKKDVFANCKLSKDVEEEAAEGYTADGISFKKKSLYSEKDAEIISYLKENGLSLPDNLFVIGTVNMDDTTHQFSRKVIDRAFTIEMNGGNMADMFNDESKSLLEYRNENNVVPLATFRPEFVRAYEVLDNALYTKYSDTIKTKIPKLLGNSDGTADEDSINGVLNNTPFRVSYRVQNELVLYLSVLIEQAGYPEEIDSLIGEAVLAILLEKVLPRVQGEQKQLATKNGSNVLKDLKAFVTKHFAPAEGETNGLYQKVVRKLDEMDKKLDNYYTNFF